MKKVALLLILCLACAMSVQAQWEARMQYNFGIARGDMAYNIRQAHGVVLEGTYTLPKTPIAVGLEMLFSGYGHDKSRQTYTFDDGSTTETDVHVFNNVASFHLVTRVNLLRNTPVIPYIHLKGGVSRYFTTLRIDDPQDIDDCHPLESDILQGDVAFTGSAGFGARLDMGTMFKQMDKGRFFIDFSTNYTFGSKVDYMSVHKPTENRIPVADVVGKFINTHHQVVHEHHVGYVYRSAIEMLDFRLGAAIRF